MAGNIKDVWLFAIRNIVVSAFRDLGKGWFNLNETQHDVYAISKLKGLLTMLRFMMQDCLRNLLTTSMNKYAHMLEKHANIVVKIITPANVINQHEQLVRFNPLLSVDSTIEDGGVVNTSASPEEIQRITISLFDRIVALLGDVPQLEPQVMKGLLWRPVPMLNVPQASHTLVETARERMKNIMERAVAPLREFIAAFGLYRKALTLNAADFQEQARTASPAAVGVEIRNYRAAAETAIENIPMRQRVGMFMALTEHTRNQIVKKYTQVADLQIAALDQRARSKVDAMLDEHHTISSKLHEKVRNIDELARLNDYMQTLDPVFARWSVEIEAFSVLYDVLDDFMYHVPMDQFRARWNAAALPIKLEKLMSDTSALLERDKARFYEQLITDEESFARDVIDMRERVATFSALTNLSELDKIQTTIQEARRRTSILDNRMQVFKRRQILFGEKVRDYPELADLERELAPYDQLWTSASNWMLWKKTWFEVPFFTLNAEELTSSVMGAWSALNKSVRVFRERELADCLDRATYFKTEVENFKKYMPLVRSLLMPGMRPRHWQQLQHQTGVDFGNDKRVLLSQALECGLDAHEGTVAKIADVAMKEYAIEQGLEKLQYDWDGILLDVVPTKFANETFIVRGTDTIQQSLDDSAVMIQSMSFSPYKGPFEQKISWWDQKLTLMAEVLEAWLLCQRQWLYLAPIFNSEDIRRQLPVEGKRFANVDHIWRRIMNAAQATPAMMQFCMQSKLLEHLRGCNSSLEQIQRSLSEYLETKRAAFPRFYFLSNDEMLQILSQTRDPTAVQEHLHKCFENIASLQFTSDYRITAMYSAEGEVVPFTQTVQATARVEEWLKAVETMMRLSMQDMVKRAFTNYTEIPRRDWIRKWPGQAVLVVSQIVWTARVTDALAKGTLAAYHQECIAEIEDMTKMVMGKLTALENITLGALITLSVHSRDVVKQMLQAGVSSEKDFDWLAQLRYYMEEGFEVAVRMVNASLKYANEYLGNTTRLVVTPLTDRCYLTLTSALHLQLGGAPQGPAGTGKTETTKDLAKAVAKQCVVFNCSEGLDHLAMGKFFTGLASSGAWACFDEFNRINLEVLSVIAQQILSIQKAIQRRDQRFVFEGKDIPLEPTCAVFITMNPGYAGRSELPDNLKALFRPVAMMVPDYAMIAEISLFSCGFSNAGVLARKMVATFRLSSEQLSSQDHYDFGMRAVKTVISAAGVLKRREPTMNEDLLLLRALRECNAPKFLAHDLPLFNGIISDLFPGIKEYEPNYTALYAALATSAVAANLQPTDLLKQKAVQLYQTMEIRHGVMLVGPTGGGKTCVYRMLSAALTSLKDTPGYAAVHSFICNPKAVTMGQLYGENDESTHEWTEGVLEHLMKAAVSGVRGEHKWVIFDGPVDAVWIENMNTVLDDNKKLCLVSGEIIPLTPDCNLLFEVDNLSVASPATVSRCGMVYLDPLALGIQPIIQSYLNTLPAHATACEDRLRQLFEQYAQPALDFVRGNLREPVPTCNTQLVSSLCNLLDSFWKMYAPAPAMSAATSVTRRGAGGGEPAEESHSTVVLETIVEPVFLFSLVWSFGATADKEGFPEFDQYLRKHMMSQQCKVPFPDDGLVYDFVFDSATLQWTKWTNTVPQYVVDVKASFHDIIVPTAESVRYTYLLNLLLTNGKHVLCCGSTGTGKTVSVVSVLMNMPNTMIPISVQLSGHTSANQLQDLLDSKFEKRRKDVYGAPAGQRITIFVDELNMPAAEEYGAQPPIELLRQWMDHEGWYDRKTLHFRKLIDVAFVSAMAAGGGGRQQVTPRYLRHFNLLTFTDVSDESLFTVFNTILAAFMKPFQQVIQKLTAPIVIATVAVYRIICKELRPTPSKSHYTFNLRDLAKVFQGVLSADANRIVESRDVLRLWAHECTRVFEDRLNSTEDRVWFRQLLRTQMEACFKETKWGNVIGEDKLLFGDFLLPGADRKIYTEITDYKRLQKVVEEYLSDHNDSSNHPMRLVMFSDAIEHIVRICRILRQPRGSALLLGVGGSGRQSLARLASYISDYVVFQIQPTKGYGSAEFHEDVKTKVLLPAGVEGKSVVFLFTDTQLVRESFLEDINNILNTGEVANIWTHEEVELITNTFKPICQQMGLPLNRTSVHSQFLKTVQRNLHIVLCMSPVGVEFRNRLRLYPSLVNCCTIDYFNDWPEEALRNVAADTLREIFMHDPKVLSALAELCTMIHTSVVKTAQAFLQEMGRRYYVTATSFLELLQLFRKLLFQRRDDLGRKRQYLKIGLEKLLTTGTDVHQMQEELTALKPVLVQTQAQTEELMKQLEHDQKSADETRAVVLAEDLAAERKAEATKAIAADAKRDLDEALPALEAAVASLKSLNRADLVELRSMLRPPNGVKLVLEAVCIMKGVHPKIVDDPQTMKKTTDYWEPAKLMLGDAKFMDSLLKYDKDHIPEPTIQKIKRYIEKDDFKPAAVAKVSRAAMSLCQWVIAMEQYHNVAKIVAPKRERLREAQADLEHTLELLKDAKRRLKDVEDAIEDLQRRYRESVTEKDRLILKVQDCEVRLDRAQKLIGGLGGERTRWNEMLGQLERDHSNMLGDALVSAASVAYLGAFTISYRSDLYKTWHSQLVEMGVPHTRDCTLRSVLGNITTLEMWKLFGLPGDNLSLENGIIMAESRRWPLLIDPQGQADKFVMNKEKKAGLETCKLTDPDFIRTLRTCVQFGKPLLIRDVGETLDTALDPLLLQQTYSQGGTKVIKVGDSAVPYSEDFRLFITTSLPNPHYLPDIATRVTLLNFTLTLPGLEEQLLALVVMKERPDLEEQKSSLMRSNAQMRHDLEELEDRILTKLSQSAGNILDDSNLIDTLSDSKTKWADIQKKVVLTQQTEKEIDITRNQYVSVAHRASILFFTITDLAGVDPMYQFSLNWFMNLFTTVIEKTRGQVEVTSDKDETLRLRLKQLCDDFTSALYRNVCRSLFARHKLLFSFFDVHSAAGC
eukprot:TRINITY_DN713_c0_g2_i1.p1 TRINITY_DN713_c0_g2~~TRINITY_DN713_c0_g2_i1.p1  ORF type:complete len:3408 (-),score=943.41 TRINITY_DN713_c0_g2_i1:2225-11140(-)